MKPEAKLKKQIMDYLKTVPDCFSFRVEQRPGMGRGIADILVCYHGRFCAIEVKTYGNTPTPLQQRFLEQVGKSGGWSTWVHSIDEVKALIK